MKTNALLIFTRNPELGKVKTRLAKTIGNEKALAVYKDLLWHTMTQTQLIDCDKFVFYDTTIIEDDIWDQKIYTKKVQANGDLGNRMHSAFSELFNMGYENCIIVGSDLFDLRSTGIETAFEKLSHHDIVLGPAEDGGYYLLGLKRDWPALFKNKNWGTSSVFKDTMKDLEDQNVVILEILNDIDTFEDLERSSYDTTALQKLEKEAKTKVTKL